MTRWLLRTGLVLVLGVHFGGPAAAQEPLPPPSAQVPAVPPPAVSPYAPYAPSVNPYGPYGPIPSPPPTAYTGGSVITPIAPPVLMEIPEGSAPVPNPYHGTLARLLIPARLRQHCANCNGGEHGDDPDGNGNGRRRGVMGWLNHYGVCCWSHFNNLTCSSFGSDMAFAYGSCRTFFGEPCNTRPPTIPVPVGWGGTPIRYP